MFDPKLNRETIREDVLRRLPLHHLCPRWHYDHPTRWGQVCLGDPPGYPSYFLAHAWAPNGNDSDVVLFDVEGAARLLCPHTLSGPERIANPETGKIPPIQYTGADYWPVREAAWHRLLHALYQPLPFDHPRVQAWVALQFTHFHTCYRDPDGRVTKADDHGTFIYPVPGYKLRHFHDDERFSDTWRARKQAAVAAENTEIIRLARKRATFDNHQAVVAVRKHYPDFGLGATITIRRSVAGKWTERCATAAELIERSETYHPGDWWERHAEQPDPEACAEASLRGDWRDYLRHRDGWCQFCGALSEAEEEKREEK